MWSIHIASFQILHHLLKNDKLSGKVQSDLELMDPFVENLSKILTSKYSKVSWPVVWVSEPCGYL